ncbi:MAG TPA: hypothetical protein VFO16_04040 [Pseudonocardiaceae bacterium]|nr:hypothetical protein [Pseudonocardiaceae bacterium]
MAAVIVLLAVAVLARVAVSHQPIALSSTDNSVSAQEESSQPGPRAISSSLEVTPCQHKGLPLVLRSGGQRLAARPSHYGDAAAAGSAVELFRGPPGYQDSSTVMAGSGVTRAALQVMRC